MLSFNRTNIIYITTAMSQRLNILCYRLYYSFLYKDTVRVGILLTRGKHLHDCIISLRGEVSAHKRSLTLPLFIEVLVPSQKVSGHVFVCWTYQFYLFLRFGYLILFFILFHQLFELYRDLLTYKGRKAWKNIMH